MACQCKTAPGGGIIVCDGCAAAQIDAITALIGGEYAAGFPNVLTPIEYQGIQSAVSGWLDGLQGSQEGRAR